MGDQPDDDDPDEDAGKDVLPKDFATKTWLETCVWGTCAYRARTRSNAALGAAMLDHVKWAHGGGKAVQ